MMFAVFLISCVVLLVVSDAHNDLFHNDQKRKNALLSNCKEFFITQDLDHFNFGAAPNDKTSFQERYFVCGGTNWMPNNTIFFYTGNEANVELYVNNTGLMWENADDFNAIMIFAEHRYWGKSIPFTQSELDANHALYAFVSPDQALADYAVLIRYLKSEWNSWSSPVIGFGGSYGGMLCTWMRIKYPQWIDGCIAGSAPVLDFEGLHPPIDPKFYSQIVTFDASTKGGANDICKDNIHSVWPLIFDLAQTLTGRQELSQSFHLCSTPQNSTVAKQIAYWASDAISTMAMGSYPYPSSYMTQGHGDLPAYPIRAGCKLFLDQPLQNDSMALLQGMSDFINILYNVTQQIDCYRVDDTLYPYISTAVTPSAWNWMACTDITLRGVFADSASDGINDMFWQNPWNATAVSDACYRSLGVRPRLNWAQVNYGGYLLQDSGVKNIVFSNGECDPWSGGGVHFNNSENAIYAISTGMVGHHMDLMFSTKNDPQSVIQARQFELQQITEWIKDQI